VDFAFSEQQEQVRELAGRFAAERVAPGYATRERTGRLEPELLRGMGELGLIGADLPEELGGQGLDGVTNGLIVEAIAGADHSAAYVQLLGSLNGSILALHAEPDLARQVVPEICRGERLVALGLTEPRGGSDAANLQLKARRSNDGYVLSGEKTSISLIEQASDIILFARTGEPSDGARGVTAFLVPLDQPGVSRSRFQDVGTRAVGRGSVFFDGVKVPEERRIGPEGAGFRTVMQGFDYSRTLIGLQCLAPAAASLAETWRYVTERQAFGNPLAKYQGVTEPLAEAETLLAAARLLCYRTLWLRDRHLPHTAEAAMCKWWVPKLSFETIHRCLLTHGHAGYSTDLPHQQRLRDVMGLQIGDGTEQIQKMIIAREKVGRVAVPYA
jgi:cyclohexanecarboxyl-CoA dehydrogenase